MVVDNERRWFWATLMLSSLSIVAVVFAVWELIEYRFFEAVNYATLHYLYITRGVASSLLLAVWAAWFVLRQRRSAEDDLRVSREHYRDLLDASPGALAVYDSSLRVLEWNVAAEQLYGYRKSEVLGQILPSLPKGRDLEMQEWLEQAVRCEAGVEVDTHRVDKEQTPIPVQLRLCVFHEKPGQQQQFVEVTEDLRERISLQKKLLEIEKLSTVGNMAAGTAHHLNTPLAAMLLRVQLMRDRMHHAACGEDLHQLEMSLRFCQQFVRRLLDFSRHSGPMAQEQLEVQKLVESVLRFLAPTIRTKQIQTTCDFHTLNGHCVLGDRDHLETLLLILLSNALDAIPSGGTIAVRGKVVSKGRLDLEIEDNGCGISEADQFHIFEPFFTTKPPGKGTGLGLAIARNIAADHGGSIRLVSQPGSGTTVSVWLPTATTSASVVMERT